MALSVQLLSELDKAAKELATEIPPNTATAQASPDDDTTQGMESQPTPATTLMDNLGEPPDTEEHKSKRARLEPGLEHPHKAEDLKFLWIIECT